MLNISDCELHTEDGSTFPAHKSILAMKSKYFSSKFRNSEGQSTRSVLIPGTKGEILEDVLLYLYTGEIHITENNFSDIMVAASDLLLRDILAQAKKLVGENLTVNNCITTFTAANKIGQADIARRSFRFIEMHFESVILGAKNIHELPLEEFKRLLTDRNLHVRDESAVWLAIVEWVEAHSPSSLPLVPEFLAYVAIGDVNERLSSEILNHEIVSNNKFCSDISKIKSAHPDFNQHQIIPHFVLREKENIQFSYIHRSSTSLHFICCQYSIMDAAFFHRVYLIDQWRQILEVHEKEEIIILNRFIYVLDVRKLTRYDVVGNEIYQCKAFPNTYFYRIVTLGKMIYVLGCRFYRRSFWTLGRSFREFGWGFLGRSFLENIGLFCRTFFGYPMTPERFTVQFYDTEADEWYHTTPMFPIADFEAAALGDCIYIVGHKPNSRSQLIAQVYDAGTRTWSLLPAPKLRTVRSLAAYQGKVFALGVNSGHFLKNVEVFDTSRQVWYMLEDLPYAYVDPGENEFRISMKVINENLIVSGALSEDCRSGHSQSAVMWSEGEQRWKVIEEPSPKSKLCYYSIHTVKDPESVNKISMINKDRRTVFEKSPFSDICL